MPEKIPIFNKDPKELRDLSPDDFVVINNIIESFSKNEELPLSESYYKAYFNDLREDLQKKVKGKIGTNIFDEPLTESDFDLALDASINIINNPEEMLHVLEEHGFVILKARLFGREDQRDDEDDSEYLARVYEMKGGSVEFSFLPANNDELDISLPKEKCDQVNRLIFKKLQGKKVLEANLGNI